MGSERRLHPLTLLFEIGGDLRQIAIPFLVVLFVSQSRSGETRLFAPLAVLVVTTVVAIARYFSFTYRYEASELVVRSGIFVRKERHIPYDRIQNIDAVQNLGHRVLGVVKVQVQTGAGTEPEATLSVLPISALEEMRALVLARQRPTVSLPSSMEEAHNPPQLPGGFRSPISATRTLHHLPLRELVLSGFIDNRGLVLILGGIGLITQVDPLADLAADRITSWIPGVTRADFSVSELSGNWMILVIAAAILSLLLFVRLMSTVWAAIRLHGFRLSRTGDELKMEYGSFTRVTATIPVRRIQTIAVHETVLHRLLDRAAVRVTTAGGGAGASGGAEREWLAPIIHCSALPDLLGELHPGLDLGAIQWRRAHPAAFGRIARTSLAIAVAIAGALAFFIGQWAIPLGVLLMIRALVRARSHVRHLGWSALPDGVVFRGGWLRQRTTIARFSRIQAVALTESPLDRRTSMTTISVDTAAAPLGMRYLARTDARELEEIIVARAAQTEFAW